MRILLWIVLSWGLCLVLTPSKPCPIDSAPSFTDGLPDEAGNCTYRHFGENGALVHAFTDACPTGAGTL
jgi:hypothetical protein